MIIRSTFRAPGGLGDHLQRADTNERVVLRDDLSQGCELNIQNALDDFAALGVDITNEKSLVHFVVSPSRVLADDQDKRMIDVIHEAYSISATQPALVVEHDKPGETGRPSHFHIVFPRRDIVTGRLIRDSYYKTKNDRLAVQLDAEFEVAKIVPIVHAKSVGLWLSSNDPPTLALIEAAGGLRTPKRRPPDTPTAAEKRRAAVAGIDLADFAKRALDAFDAAQGSPSEADWFTAELRLARGDKEIMIVDVATGFCGQLHRNLNAAAKRAGDARRWKGSDLNGLLPIEAPTLSAAVAASKRADPTIKRRGRKPSASLEEIAAEVARRREIEANGVGIKAEARVARQKARDVGREIERNSIGLVTTAKGIAAEPLIGGPAAVAAVVLFNLILRRKLLQRRKQAIAAAAVRRGLDKYFMEVRNRRQASNHANSEETTISLATSEAPASPLPAKAPFRPKIDNHSAALQSANKTGAPTPRRPRDGCER